MQHESQQQVGLQQKAQQTEQPQDGSPRTAVGGELAEEYETAKGREH
jgi:hypothetical protein